MTITASLLNELENKFTAHGLGYESIAESELTYQKCMDIIENGYMPVLSLRYYLRQVYNGDSEYMCRFFTINGPEPPIRFTSSSPTEIMTAETK